VTAVQSDAATHVATFDCGVAGMVRVPVTYITRDDQLADCIDWASARKTLLVDIETDGSCADGLNWRTKKIATLQVGFPAGDDPRAYVICVRSVSERTLRPLLALLEDPTIVKLGQNLGFEIIWTLHKWGVRWERTACTQTAELLLRAGLWAAKGKTKQGEGGDKRVAYSHTSMAKLCQRYLDMTPEKGNHVRLRFWTTPPGALSREQLHYAAGDVVFPWFIAQAQKPEIRERGLAEVLQIEFDLLPVIADSRVWGIGVDRAQWEALAGEYEVKALELRQQLDDLVRPFCGQADLFADSEHQGRPTLTVGGKVKELNYGATEQVKRMFQMVCRGRSWPVEIVTSFATWYGLKRKYGAHWIEKHPDVEIEYAPDFLVPEDKAFPLFKCEGPQLMLGKLRKQLPADLVDAYVRYNKTQKLVVSFGHRFLRHLDPDDRLRTEWHQLVTTTGRMSSEPNLQQIPRIQSFRACFIPKPGYSFIIRDYSAIEPRLSAEASQDPLYLDTFRNNQDIYVRVGEAHSGQTIDKKTEIGAVLRQAYKATVLGTAYNMGPWKMRNSQTLALAKFIEAGTITVPTIEETREKLDGFFKVAPGIKVFQNRCIAQADPESPQALKVYDRYRDEVVTYVTGLTGRKRFFPADATNTYTEAPNAPIQGDSATITKLAANLVYREFAKRGIEVHIANYVHDELIIEVPTERAEEASLLMKDCMEDAGRRYITSVPVIAEASGGGLGIYQYWHKD
jgi:DNA polymerase I-like protein with 3'-5' exonuclease and polymerase domains